MFLTKLSADYGNKYLLAIVLFFGATKGLGGGLIKALALPYYQTVHYASVETYHQIYSVAVLLPWSTKPLFGVLSDMVPIRGYRKRYYLIVASGVISAAVGYVSGGNPSLGQSVIAIAIASVGVVICDLLMEASYSEHLRDARRISGNTIVVLAWLSVTIGNGTAALLAGSLSDAGFIKPAIAIVTPFPLLFMGTVLAGWIPEKKVSVDIQKIALEMPSIIMSLTMVVAAVICGIVIFDGTVNTQLAVAVICSIVLVTVAHRALPQPIFMCNVYMFIVECSTVNFVGATDYFYTSGCKSTPSFNYTFYTTWSTIIASIFGAMGLVFFSKLQHLPIKTIFAGLTCIKCLVATVEVMQAARWNVIAGVDDKTFYLAGDAIVGSVVSMMYFVPMVILTTRLVERGTEAITYALLAGTQNFGQLVAAIFGSYLTELYNIKDCQFENLPTALLIGHIAMPMIAFPLAYYFLPDISLKTL